MATFSAGGSYTLRLTANDGAVGEREIAVAVLPGGDASWTATADPGLHLAAASGTTAQPVHDATLAAKPLETKPFVRKK